MSQILAAAFPPLARLDAPSLRQLEAAARTVIIPAGTVIFSDGADCASYVLVLEGSVRVQKVAENGREIVLYRVEAGQSCVLTTACLIGNEAYSAEGVAETEVKAVAVPAASFRSLMGQSEAFRSFVFESYSRRMADLLVLIEEVAFGRIDARLAAWLLQRATAGDEINASHQEIAAELGTAREVVSRQLKEFERRGWVALFRLRIVLRDRHGLRRIGDAL